MQVEMSAVRVLSELLGLLLRLQVLRFQIERHCAFSMLSLLSIEILGGSV